MRPPVWTTRLTTPGAGAFALLFGLDALARALVTVALPVQTLEIMGSDEGVSILVLCGAVASLSMAFLVPRLALWMGRGRMCTLALLLIFVASGLFALQLLPSQVMGFVLRASGTAILFAGYSMFVMDHIRRRELGRSEPLRMLSVGFAWTAGPLIGVQLAATFGPWAPFAATMAVLLLAIAYFWMLRLQGVAIVRATARRDVTNPFANIMEYLKQPRLLLAWLHAIGRGMFWNSFIIYTPLYAVATGLGAEAGGLMVSIGSSFMVLMPLWGMIARRFGIRRVSLICFPIGAASLIAAGLLADRPLLGAVFLVIGACSMTVIDGYGNALFLRACKPSQRVTMTPVFSTHRDLGEIVQAILFVILLSFLPVTVVYVALGVVLFALTLLATRIHPRL